MGYENVHFTDLSYSRVQYLRILSINLRRFLAVCHLSSSFLVEICVLFISNVIQLRTISSVEQLSPTSNHRSNVELHLRPSARLTWLIPYIEAIAAAAAAAVGAAAAGGAAEAAEEKQQQPQQQRQRR